MEIKKAIKRIAALAGGAIMAGATLAGAFAALENLPHPFVTEDGVFDAYVVVGTATWNTEMVPNPAGLAQDVAVAIDVATAFGQKATTAAETGGAETVTGGVQIKVPGDDFNYGEDIHDIDDIYSDGDLNILADGKYVESKGNTRNNVEYSQKLTFSDGSGQLVFQKNTETDDEKTDSYLYFPDGTQLFTYKVTFTGGVDYDATSIKNDFDGTTITLLGQKYTISSASGTPGTDFKLELLSGEVEATQGEYTTQTYTLGDKTYEVEVLIVSDDTATVKFKINGETTDALGEGDTYTLSDGTEVGVREVLPNEGSEAAGADQVTFYLGAQKLTLEDGKEVKVNDEEIDGWTTQVTFSGSSGELDSVSITATPDDNIFLEAGDKLVDPIFGAWEIYFSGIEKSTEEIKITTSGDDGTLKVDNLNGAELSIPMYLSDDSGGTVTFGDEVVSTVKITQGGQAFTTAGTAGHMLIKDGDSCTGGSAVTECEDLKLLVVGSGGEARIFEIKDIDTTNNKIDLKDLTTGKTWEDLDYTDGAASNLALDIGTIQLTIDEAGKSVTATDINLYSANAAFKTSGSGVITLSLTDLDTGADEDYAATVSLADDNSHTLTTVKVYDDDRSITANDTSDGTNGELKIAKDTSLTWHPEEKDSDTYWALDATDVGSKAGVNEYYGVLFKYDNEDKDDWTAYYPEEQAYAKVYLSETGKLTTTTTSGAVNVNYIDVTTGVSRVDTDFDTAVPDKPVILVGGPAVNKLVYNLAEEGKTQGVADYAENTALIQYIEDAFGTNDALIIAGHMAKDTQKAGKVVAGYVLNGQFSDLMQGNKVVFDTETMAKVE